MMERGKTVPRAATDFLATNKTNISTRWRCLQRSSKCYLLNLQFERIFFLIDLFHFDFFSAA